MRSWITWPMSSVSTWHPWSFVGASSTQIYSPSGFVDLLNQSCKPHSPNLDVTSRSDNFYRQRSFNRVDAFVIADNIGDFSADVFNQLKLIVGEGFDSGSENENSTSPSNFQHEEDGKNPSESELDEEASHGTSVMAVRLNSPGTDSLYFESEEEMEFDINKPNFQNAAELGEYIIIEDEDVVDISHFQENMSNAPLFSSPAGSAQDYDYMDHDPHFGDFDFEGSSQIDESLATLQAMEFDDDQQELQGEMDQDPVQDTASKKGKGPQQSPRIEIDHHNNNLYDVVMGENNSKWPPESYKCKIEGCGFQGAWRARQVHFEIKHAKEWKEATGRDVKQLICGVEGCDYKTTRSTYMVRHRKNSHPEYRAANSKNQKKCKT